jgi:8-oxo-dGTP diphosphatase
MNKVNFSVAGHPTPIVTVDVVMLALIAGELHIACVQRAEAPHQGELALLGGYAHTDEDSSLEDTARRVLRLKAGIKRAYLEQLQTFSGPTRDPRGWSLSVAYCALMRPEQLAALQTAVQLIPISALPKLPFDHKHIVAAALRRVQNKSSYSSLPTFLLPSTFTLSEMQTVYEQVLGGRLDRVSFRRKMIEQDFIEPVAGQFKTGVQRPAQMYRLKKQTLTAFERAFQAD